MALGLKAWCFSALGLCALVSFGGWLAPTEADRISALLFRNRSETERIYHGFWNDVRNARSTLTPARENLILLERRDSIFALVDTLEGFARGLPTLLVDDRLPVGVRNSTDLLLTELLPQPSEGIESVPLVVAVIVDTLRIDTLPRGYVSLRSNIGYALPSEGQRTCVAVVSVQKTAISRWAAMENEVRDTANASPSMLPATPPSLFGPCAYYAEFGMPGSAFAEWLEVVDYQPALLPVWLRGTLHRDRSRLNRPDTRFYQPLGGIDIHSCIAGDRSRCLSAVTQPIPEYAANRWYAELAVPRPEGIVSVYSKYRSQINPLGSHGGQYLSDLLLEMGKDRFAMFWQTDSSLEESFQSAFGVSLEEWTMQWARQVYGNPPRGPVVRAGSVIFGLVFAAAFLGASMVYRGSREIA